MSRQWAVNASPLILLAKIGRLDLLSELSDALLVPEVVLREIGAKPEGQGVLARVFALSGLKVEAGVVVSAELTSWNLGSGESQVLSLAASMGRCRAVLDDLAARRCAQALGVPLIGTVGIVLRAKRKGVIPSARSLLQDLRRVGLYASDLLIESALAHLGE